MRRPRRCRAPLAQPPPESSGAPPSPARLPRTGPRAPAKAGRLFRCPAARTPAAAAKRPRRASALAPWWMPGRPSIDATRPKIQPVKQSCRGRGCWRCGRALRCRRCRSRGFLGSGEGRSAPAYDHGADGAVRWGSERREAALVFSDRGLGGVLSRHRLCDHEISSNFPRGRTQRIAPV